jgi:transposase
MAGARSGGIMAAGKEATVMGRYSRQFREEAIKLVTEEGYKPNEAARKLGIPHSTFDKWIHNSGWQKPQVDAPSSASSASSEDPKVLAIQVRDLQKQVKRLEMEKEILKKATAFFASQNL